MCPSDTLQNLYKRDLTEVDSRIILMTLSKNEKSHRVKYSFSLKLRLRGNQKFKKVIASNGYGQKKVH